MSARHVVRIITRLNIGGPARQANLLTAALPGWTTTLVAGTPPPEEGELLDDGIEVVRVPLVRPPSPLDDLRSLASVTALLRRERPAVVHTHMAKAGTIGRAAARLVRPRPRTIHTFHGHVLDGYFSPRVERAVVEVERRLARRTDVLIAVSAEIRDQLLDLGVGTPAQYRVIPLGFDLTAHLAVDGQRGVLRRALGIDATTPLIGAIGRLAPIKDHVTLLHAMTEVGGAHLAVLGDGELRAELEETTDRLGLRDRVHFAGWWLDVPDALADLDLVALTSRNEGTPVSLIEAAAAGRAVVATDVGGVRSVVRDGETGLLCPAGDARSIAAAINGLLADPDRRARYGAAGRASVDAFDARRLVRDIAALYDELLS